MKRLLTFSIFVVLAALSLLLAGCGGSGGGGGNSNPSPFVGTFAGLWTSSDAQNGTTSFTIANSGNVTGTSFNITTSESATLVGHINSDGTCTIDYTYPSFPTVHATGALALSNGDQTLSGSVTGSGATTTVNLTRQ